VPVVDVVEARPRARVRVLARTREDDLDTLANAEAVVGVGRGVDPAEYEELTALLQLLGAELGATRKVTDAGWLPRARQIGITGRAITPRLFVSIGASGKFNHMVGVRAAGTVLAINPDRDAPVFAVADVGIVADWHDAVPALVAALHRRAGDTAASAGANRTS
jgi:electron transfer flavoprotein alpha subunit